MKAEESYDYELLGMACIWVYYFLALAPTLLIGLFKIQSTPIKEYIRVRQIFRRIPIIWNIYHLK